MGTKSLSKSNFLNTALFSLYLILFFSVFCSFRAVSSISIGLLVIVGILKNKIEHKPILNKNVNSFFFWGCVSFYVIQVFGLLYTQHREIAINDLQTKSGLVIIPLALCCTDFINDERRKKLSFYYSIILLFVSFFCLVSAAIRYQQTHETDLFFYHTLVSPFKQHAVYFSIYVFIAILFLSESLREKNFITHKSYYIFLILFFTFFLFLLASKLIIAFFLICVIYYLITEIITKKKLRLVLIASITIFVVAVTTIFSTTNIVSKRFADLLNGDINIIKREKYDPGVYFNGLQFRLLQWRLVTEILNKNHDWLTGVSPGDAQLYLDKEYLSKDVYAGNPEKGTHGYLVYNTHNQFLESLLQSGIIGLAAFCFICFSLIRMAWLDRNRKTTIIVLLLLAYSFSESLLETQYSIFLFTFFPLFIFIHPQKI